MSAGREVFFVKNYVGLCSSEIICISQGKGGSVESAKEEL